MPTRTEDPNRYPRGLNRRKVQALIKHYENQTDAQAIAEAEAAVGYQRDTANGPTTLAPAATLPVGRLPGSNHAVFNPSLRRSRKPH